MTDDRKSLNAARATASVYDLIDAIVAPAKAAQPGISNGEVADLLPEYLRQPFWERAVERYLQDQLANTEEQP